MEFIQIFLNTTISFLLGFFIITLTWVSGYPLLSYLKSGSQGLSKNILGVITGLSLLSITGIICELIKIDPLPFQFIIILTGFCLIVHLKHQNNPILNFSYSSIIIPFIAFCLIFWTYFSTIESWMGGDAVAHATIIQLLVDKQNIPINLPPSGSYWEYYPKGFHLYSYPFATIFGVMSVIQIIPVFLTALIPLTMAAILKEFNCKDAAWFTLISGLFCIPQVWAALIWGGYPSLTAILLICGAILAFFTDKRLIILFCLVILFIHAREIAILITGLIGIIGYRFYTEIQSGKLKISLIITSCICATIMLFFSYPSLFELVGSISNPGDIALQLIRWGWIFPACIAISLLLGSKKIENIALFGWMTGILFFFFAVLATDSTNSFPLTRILTDLAIPLSGFFGLAIAAIMRGFGNIPHAKMKVTGLLLILGIITTGGTFGYYHITWALPSDDKNALEWLSHQGYSNGILINIDETGGLAYPIAGIPVSHPRVVPGLEKTNEIYAPLWNTSYLQEYREIKEKTSDYYPVLLYISSVSLNKPGYTSPFSEYPYPYPNGSISLPLEYTCIYDKGARIYEL